MTFPGKTARNPVLGLLALGTVLSLWDLLSHAHGPHAALSWSLAAVLFVLGLFCVSWSGARLPLLLVPLTALSLSVLSAGGTSMNSIGGSLAVSGVICGLVLLGGMTIVAGSLAKPAVDLFARVEHQESPRLPESAELHCVSISAGATAGQRIGQKSASLDDGATEEHVLDGGVVQSWKRYRDSEGERLEAALVVDFSPGQKHAYVHLPFAPMLSGRLEAFCECVDDGSFTAEFDLLRCYGGRLSLRRSQAADSARTEISVVVLSTSAASRAA